MTVRSDRVSLTSKINVSPDGASSKVCCGVTGEHPAFAYDVDIED